ncbi:hypothetical protein E4T47_05993 [Aureobasidium subglaciale]|nr:hypothetical protein E4T47_05993 [Aureobasidium subglaciale]
MTSSLVVWTLLVPALQHIGLVSGQATNTSASAWNVSSRADLSSALSCAHSLSDWLSSSSSWSIYHNLTYISEETQTQPGWSTEGVPVYYATSVTTLCDGYPRVVGSADSTHKTTILGTPSVSTTTRYNITEYSYNVPPYSVSTAPCTIQQPDCQALYDSNNTFVQSQGTPICSFSSTSTSSKSFPTGPKGYACSYCNIVASTARLLYWPVRTIDGSGDLCNSTAQTQGLPRTGDGPNTFVADGVTITSPSVGISLVGVSRQDGCGITVASTVVALHATDVVSVRGARALYSHYPFQYQDLNYKCRSRDNTTTWIQDFPGDGCYQEVPAEAYFSGESAFVWHEYYPTAYDTALTIGPDYRPYILPPSSMTEWANEVYSTDCYIQVDGVWDPPYALVQGTTIVSPTLAWQTAAKTSTSVNSQAVPAQTVPSMMVPTSDATPGSRTTVHPSNAVTYRASDHTEDAGPGTPSPESSLPTAESVENTSASSTSEYGPDNLSSGPTATSSRTTPFNPSFEDITATTATIPDAISSSITIPGIKLSSTDSVQNPRPETTTTSQGSQTTAKSLQSSLIVQTATSGDDPCIPLSSRGIGFMLVMQLLYMLGILI